MDKERQNATKIAHQFVVYQESEQADVDKEEHQFDALWQSIYDVCKLVHYQIIDDISEEEYQEAYTWLKSTQNLCDDYKDFEMEF